MLEDLVNIEDSAKKIGLCLNDDKCEVTVFGPNQDAVSERFPEFPPIKLVSSENTVQLGPPLGTKSLATDISSKQSCNSRLLRSHMRLKKNRP